MVYKIYLSDMVYGIHILQRGRINIIVIIITNYQIIRHHVPEIRHQLIDFRNRKRERN